MSSLQKFVTAILPASWAQSMEAESRSWMMRCPCGFERSVWDNGGIRWKASGQQKIRGRCQACGQLGWHTLYRKTPGETELN